MKQIILVYHIYDVGIFVCVCSKGTFPGEVGETGRHVAWNQYEKPHVFKVCNYLFYCCFLLGMLFQKYFDSSFSHNTWCVYVISDSAFQMDLEKLVSLLPNYLRIMFVSLFCLWSINFIYKRSAEE